MKKTILTIMAGLTAFALVTGFAASMTVNGGDLGVGSDVVAACDTDGIDVKFGVTPNGKDVNEVTLEGVHADCEGQDYYLELEDGATPTANSLHTDNGTVTLTAGDQTITVSPAVDAESVEGVNLTIVE